ncbi:hypothetical protein CEP52_003434 [Fusarium oligoseptatum]|nr:hypothetical protein CEP52_003434 [Fusarium oligoseptatum]
MAWGTPAGKRVQKVDKVKHLVLQSVHPSPLSASRGFFDCGHFKKANEWLVSRYGADGEIDWALAPGASTKAKVEEPEAPEEEEEVKESKKTETKSAEKKKDEDDKENDADFAADEEALEEALALAEEEEKRKKGE